jgi:hypothetical protein
MFQKTDFTHAVALTAKQSRPSLRLAALLCGAILGFGTLMPVNAFACGSGPVVVTEDGSVLRGAPAPDDASPQPIITPHCSASGPPNAVAANRAPRIEGTTKRRSLDHIGQAD